MPRQDKREDIIRTAMSLMAEQGFHGAPMSLIAERAGVGIGTIYRYFENRDVLIREIYKAKEERLMAVLLENYPHGRPVRECFFHIVTGVIRYFIQNPIEFQYSEQFHNSPYGIEHRRSRIFDFTNNRDIFSQLYHRGAAQQVIRDLPMGTFFNMTFAPVAWCIRDHVLGFVILDEALIQKVTEACWDSVKM